MLCVVSTASILFVTSQAETDGPDNCEASVQLQSKTVQQAQVESHNMENGLTRLNITDEFTDGCFHHWSEEKRGQYISGCSRGCQYFASLAEAMTECNKESTCGGVTYQKGGSSPHGGFQLRSGPDVFPSPTGEASWTKLCVSAGHVGSYPGYTGPLQVMGSVGASYEAGLVDIWFILSGLGTDCKVTPIGVANACGIHIHSGTTCDEASSVGGHYFSGSSDPWIPITYTANFAGRASAKITGIAIGASQDISGRAVVVHDNTGSRIACTVLPQVRACDSVWSQEKDGQYIPGCSRDCQNFTSLEQAMVACTKESTCGGVTYVYSFTSAPGYFQLRSGPGVDPHARMVGASWMKLCVGEQDHGDCYWTNELHDKYISGCSVDSWDCQYFSTLRDAMSECAKQATCGGVTYQVGGNSPHGGFQLRRGPDVNPSRSGESSWKKVCV